MPQCILTSQITFMAYIHGQDRIIIAHGIVLLTLGHATMAQTTITAMELTLLALYLVTAPQVVALLWE